MEGIFFFWVTWGLWIYTTFLMKKGKKRTGISCFLLLIIILVQQQFFIIGLNFTFAFIICLFFSYAVLATKTVMIQLYMCLVSLMITLIYVGFSLLQLYDPVIIMFDASWMVACLILTVILFLIRDATLRVIVSMIGILQGDVIFTLILKDIGVNKIIGELPFFDTVAVTIFLLILWNIFELLTKHLKFKIKSYEKVEGIKV